MSKKILSIFIDESGDFGKYQQHSPYYIVTMLLHNQEISLTEKIKEFNAHLDNLGYPKHAIHSAPLIRRESIYKHDLMENRKRLFNSMFNFVRKLSVNYDCVIIDKKNCKNEIEFTQTLSKSISTQIKEDKIYWQQFDEIIIYYDNGQIELTKILISIFTTLFSNVSFRKVCPIDYILFQATDLVCTLELLSKKFTEGNISNSEKEFFISKRDFYKNYMKPISSKKIKH